MPTFKVKGKLIDNDKNANCHYYAVVKEQVLDYAKRDGVEVLDICELPPEKPRTSQIDDANGLGIRNAGSYSEEDLSNLIWFKSKGDQPVSDKLRQAGLGFGVHFPKHMGDKAAYREIFKHLKECRPDEDLVAFFISRVALRFFKKGNAGEYDDPHHPLFKLLAAELALDQKLVNSTRGYENWNIILFGSYTNKRGTLKKGGSMRTYAFKKVKSVLEEQLGTNINKDTSPIQNNRHATDLSKRSSKQPENQVKKEESVDIGTVIVSILFALAMFYFLF
jgi:hypothetical protein